MVNCFQARHASGTFAHGQRIKMNQANARDPFGFSFRFTLPEHPKKLPRELGRNGLFRL